MAFQYVAYTPAGEKVKGKVDAPNERAAEEILWKQSYTIVSISVAPEHTTPFGLGQKVKIRELVVFSQQLAMLIEAGIPIVQALQLLQEHVTSKRLRSVLGEIAMDVRQGSFISEAILKHEGVFPPLYGRLIEVGERTGNLEMVLRQLAIYLEKEEQLSRKIKGAVTYPAFVLVLAIGVVLLLMFVALPPLMDLFASFGAELPLPTRILMAITGFVTSNVIGLLGGIGGAIAVGVLFIRTEAGHWFLDRLMLRIPLINQITIQGAVARMARSMSSLLKAGIPIPEILRMVIRTQSNRVIKAGLQRVEQELLQGHGLSEPLATEPLFPRMLVQIVRVGEETGSLEGNMETLAAFYEDEVDRVVKALTDAIQPALTLFIGGVVGFVAISVIMPMYTLIGTIG